MHSASRTTACSCCWRAVHGLLIKTESSQFDLLTTNQNENGNTYEGRPQMSRRMQARSAKERSEEDLWWMPPTARAVVWHRQ
jgi:hypothetical protein